MKLINVNDKKGLGNRLTTLITCLRLSEKFNREFYVYWIKNKECNCELEDLFENNFQKYNGPITQTVFNNMCYHRNLSPIIKNNNNENLFVRSCGFVGCDSDINDIKINNRFNYTDFSPRFVSEFKKYFKLLKPKKEILNVLDTFPKEFDITIHIRLTGNSYGLDNKNEIIEKIKKIDKNKSIFVCSDDIKIYEEINKIVPIYWYEKKEVNEKKNFGNTDGTNKQMMIDSLIDIYLLSRGKTIYLSPNSSFCKISYFFSDNCEKIL
jgi:hypothetical protein